jgi:glycosyltransferase involved in cell wall biosynthesis
LKLAVLMSASSPWSREAAIRLALEGHEIQVIDVRVRDRHTYIRADDPSQAVDVQEFERCVSRINRIETSSISNFRYITASLELNRILRQQGSDCLLALYGGGFATMAYLCGFRPYAVYVVGSDVLFGGSVKKCLSRLALKAADAVFVNGQYLTERTRELAPKANLRCLYLGTDLTKFTPSLSQSLPVKIVCTRGFSEIYNNEYLVRALKEVPDSTMPFQLTFAAPGPLLNEVRSIADRILPASVRRSVEFLGGIGRERMAELLRASQVYASMSRSDGASLSLVEGLASGLFPVLSDIPANREWIANASQDGFLVPLDNPRAVADALVRAISEPELRARAAVRNRELVMERADSRKNMAILGCCLKRIVSSYLRAEQNGQYPLR